MIEPNFPPITSPATHTLGFPKRGVEIEASLCRQVELQVRVGLAEIQRESCALHKSRWILKEGENIQISLIFLPLLVDQNISRNHGLYPFFLRFLSVREACVILH